jgi:release factor glutamine methyltransferase
MEKATSSVDVRAGTRIGALFKNPPVDPADMRILLEYALGLSHVQQVTQSERELDEKEAVQISALLLRRQKGEPIAYIVGTREFYGLSFYITTDVLIPRPETELLVELAIRYLPKEGSALDMGTGSGAIAVSIAHERPDTLVTATDIAPGALDVARQNAKQHLR